MIVRLDTGKEIGEFSFVRLFRLQRLFFCCFTLCLFGCLVENLNAAPSVLIQDENYSLDLGRYMEFLESDLSSLSRDVKNDQSVSNSANAFRKNDSDLITEGYSSTPLWIRLSLENQLPKNEVSYLVLDNPHLHEVTLYEKSALGWFPLQDKERTEIDYSIPHRNIILPIQLEAESQKTLLLRIASNHSLYFRPRLMSLRSLIEYNSFSDLNSGIFFGIWFLVFCFSIFVYSYLRESTYLFYLLVVFFLGFHQAFWQGLLYSLWSNSASWVPLLSILSQTALYSSALLLIYSFTRAWITRRIKMCWRFVFGLAVSSNLLAFMIPHSQMVHLTNVLSVVVALTALAFGINGIKKKRSGSVFFVISFSLITLGALIQSGRNWGFDIPWPEISKHAFRTGSELALIFLAWAIAQRMNELKTGLVRLNNKLKKEIYSKNRNAQKLRASMEMARSANKMKSNFLANMSHEIRTPLTRILGQSVLLEETLQTSDQIELIKKIQDATGELEKKTSRILEISRSESGLYEIRYGQLDLEKLLRSILQSFKPRARQKNLSLSLQMEDGFPSPVISDGRRLREILTAILENAIEYTKFGSVEVFAETVVFFPEEHPQRFLKISIKDTGVGIDAELQKEIFKPFYQILPFSAQDQTGIGLGLSLASTLVKQMHGEIWVKSEKGRGSAFCFTLPLLQSESYKEGDSMAIHNDIELLVAEDNEEIITILSSFLKSKGYAISVATNGEEAFEYIQKNSPDLILMDIKMPVMDGLEATRRIRKWETTTGKRIPIIALTAHAFEEDKEIYKEEGFDECLVKPIDFQRLSKLIESMVEKQEENFSG